MGLFYWLTRSKVFDWPKKMKGISSKIGGFFSSKGYGWILDVEEEENDKPLL
jgi:hypothetical protein